MSHIKIGDTFKIENLTLKMKILFEEILQMFFFMQELKIVQIFRFRGAFWTKTYLFLMFDLKNDGQGHTFSRSKYQKQNIKA
jgi:hypothetical protein